MFLGRRPSGRRLVRALADASVVRSALARAARSAGLALCGLGTGGVSAAPRAEPPTSLAPESPNATLRPRHAHRVVTACTARGTGPKLRCEPTLVSGDARTELSLIPLKSRSVIGRRDQRQRLDISLGADGGPEAETVDVPAGSWELVWPGYSSRKTVVLGARTTVNIRLETTTGHCEPDPPAACSLVRSVARTLTVSLP